MNGSLEEHGHKNGAECADLYDALQSVVVVDEEPILALRQCIAIVNSVVRHHPEFCIELRYALAIAHELVLDSATADTFYAEAVERSDYTAAIEASYETFRYERLVVRAGTAPPEERPYFLKRALLVSDKREARARRIGTEAIR